MTAFIARDVLAPALARAAAIVPSRTPMPILASVLLEVSGDGLVVTATDMEIVYREKIDEIPRDPWRASSMPSGSTPLSPASVRRRHRTACG